MSTTASIEKTGQPEPSESYPPATPKSSTDTASVSKVMDDVKTLGREMKTKAKETGAALAESARDLAADSRELATQTYDHTCGRVRDGAARVETAARDRITAEPLKAVAWALGIGFLLGRFVFNGR